MSTTSPLPQQLIAGTPLMNRSGTPLNEPPPPRPQMMPGIDTVYTHSQIRHRALYRRKFEKNFDEDFISTINFSI